MRRLMLPAGGAETAGLQGHGSDDVAGGRRGGQLRSEVRLELLGRSAAVADQEGRGVPTLDAAGDVGVQAFDAVGEAEPLQEFQGAIDGGRLGRLAALAER